MLRSLLPLLKDPRNRARLVPVVEIVGSICLVVAAFRTDTALGFAALGLLLLLAAVPMDDWAKKGRR